MKRIHDQRSLQEALDRTGLSGCLNNTDKIMIREYEKGELVISPLKNEPYIFFLLEGEAAVYVLDENGSITVAARERPGSMVGDSELFLEDYHSVYVESRTKLRMLVLSHDDCRELIRTNERFTYFLFRQIIQRENRAYEMSAESSGSKEKIFFYIKNICPGQCLKGISGAADTVGCSYRQAQRAVSDLCREGRIIKTGRGIYEIKQK